VVVWAVEWAAGLAVVVAWVAVATPAGVWVVVWEGVGAVSRGGVPLQVVGVVVQGGPALSSTHRAGPSSSIPMHVNCALLTATYFDPTLI
jgi:hypothetical protein